MRLPTGHYTHCRVALRQRTECLRTGTEPMDDAKPWPVKSPTRIYRPPSRFSCTNTHSPLKVGVGAMYLDTVNERPIIFASATFMICCGISNSALTLARNRPALCSDQRPDGSIRDYAHAPGILACSMTRFGLSRKSSPTSRQRTIALSSDIAVINTIGTNFCPLLP